MMEAVLSNADHPEYGVATIPLPIPRNQYDHCVALLEALEIGDASEADCRLDSLDSAWPVLNRLVCTKVNLDELDYLAKRLDSFTVGEFSQFQAMAEKLNLASMKDLINLTFCCQQATVITDFTNLREIGRDHYMNIHGGCASMEELEQLDGEETAILLIEDNEGTVTRYGVVYDNGMQLSQLYDGKHLPCYHYEADMTAVGITSRQEPENSKNVTWVYTGPHKVVPTMSARYGTGGNNVPLVEQEQVFCITGNAIDRQPQNGGNGIGYQADLAYTLTATDHLSGYPDK